MFGNNLCQIRDIEEVKKFNRVGIAQKMDIVNRSQTLEERTGLRFKQPAENLKQTKPILPLQVRGLKSGPKFPAPTVPDVNEDFEPFFAAWYSKTVTEWRS